jgi:hypothetical protein
VVIVTCVLCVGVSTVSPAKALWVYVLNFAEPQLARWIAKRTSRGT